MSADRALTSEEQEQNEKSHTFRKRRLTLTSHRINAPLLEALAAESEEDEKRTDNIEPAAGSPGHSTLHDDCDKSKTFRKRRLTITKNHLQIDLDALEGKDDAADHISTGSNHDEKQEEPIKKKRRMSDDSLPSTYSCSTLGSKIHHAGEISRHQPLRSHVQTENRLYAPPFHVEKVETEEERRAQPVWKRRMTRSNSDDESLPFPRHIVGQYSCHGIEPIYDSEYEQDSDEKSDGDESDWVAEAFPEDHKEAEEQLKSANVTVSTPISPPKLTASAKINQDRGGIAFPYGDCRDTALFAVYDGHGQGGELVSQFALHHIQRKLKKHPNYLDNLEKAFKDTFIEVDEELKEEPTVDPLYAGTTACAALLRNKKLTISNAGDSRAVLARQKKNKDCWETIQLTEDQNPDNPEEQARIEQHGGYVSPPPEPGLSARVWLDSSCTQIGLAMSRSIGDHAVKDVGVMAEPVVTSHEIQEEDDFLILASDGVWEFISSEEAVDIVGKNISKGSTTACQLLIEAAAEKWHQEEGDYRDDITALVVQLPKVLHYLREDTEAN